MAIFDQDVDELLCIRCVRVGRARVRVHFCRFPKLYIPGQYNVYFNMRLFIYSVLHGIVSSLVLFFIPYGALFENVNYDGKNIDDYSMLAFTTFTCLVCVRARTLYVCGCR
jgi:phospholipid-translocating ATPase